MKSHQSNHSAQESHKTMREIMHVDYDHVHQQMREGLDPDLVPEELKLVPGYQKDPVYRASAWGLFALLRTDICRSRAWFLLYRKALFEFFICLLLALVATLTMAFWGADNGALPQDGELYKQSIKLGLLLVMGVPFALLLFPICSHISSLLKHSKVVFPYLTGEDPRLFFEAAPAKSFLHLVYDTLPFARMQLILLVLFYAFVFWTMGHIYQYMNVYMVGLMCCAAFFYWRYTQTIVMLSQRLAKVGLGVRFRHQELTGDDLFEL